MSQFIQAKWYHKGRLSPIQVIVIHDMEAPEKGSTAEAVARYFQTLPVTRKASAHWCVDSDSEVQCVRNGDTAFHAPGCNSNGIGIEHAGYARQKRHEWTDEYSRKMLARSAKLTARLAKRYGIPVRLLTPADLRAKKKGFTSHNNVSKAFGQSSHTDPGPNFPWDAYLGMVRAELDAINGATWTKARIAKLAAACSLAVAVFAGVTQTNNPPAPTPTPSATTTVKPTPAPTPKPTVTTPKPTPTPTVRPLVYRVLRLNARGADVLRLERCLDRRNLLAPRYVDGYYGTTTRSAVNVFVRRHPRLLPADGTAGLLTQKAVCRF